MMKRKEKKKEKDNRCVGKLEKFEKVGMIVT